MSIEINQTAQFKIKDLSNNDKLENNLSANLSAVNKKNIDDFIKK